MHIGFISPEYPTPDQPEGGLSAYVRKTAASLAERGHRVTVFVLADQALPARDGAVHLCQVGRKQWHTLWRRLPQLQPFLPVLDQKVSAEALARALWREHAEHPLDVLQTSNYFAPAYALRNNGRIPLVCRISWYPPYWRSASKGPRRLADYAWDWLDLRQVTDADRVYGPSSFLADAYLRGQGIAVNVLRTPVDLNFPEPDPTFYETRLKGQKYLLFFGSLNGIKGIDLLAHSLPELLREYRDLQLVLIGRDDGLPDGSPSVVARLREAAGDQADRLVVAGAMGKASLVPVIKHAHAVLIPSRVDNYPNVCLEAQSFGRPVIASNPSSLEEMVENGMTGFLFKSGDAEDFGRAIRRCLDLDEARYEAMVQAVREQFKKLQGEDRIAQLEIYLQKTISEFITSRDACATLMQK